MLSKISGTNIYLLNFKKTYDRLVKITNVLKKGLKLTEFKSHVSYTTAHGVLLL